MACIEFTVNGLKCSVDESTPRDTSLAAYLRYALALPGTKAMCREGGCGACIVSVRARRPSGRAETFSVNSVGCFSCLTDTPCNTSLAAYLRYALALPGTKAMCREGGCGACIVSVRARRPSGRTETFSVNSVGCFICLTDTPCNTSLAAYVRYELALPGTKAMCREGGCGACIVSVRARRPSGRTETFSVNSVGCLTDTPRHTSLAAYVRYTLALPGTKAMCREGGCGACIVSVRARRPSGRTETFSVNSVGCFSCLTDTPCNMSLAAYVRYALALPGTKAMCREGGCGACIVSVRARRPSGRAETFSVNSVGCLTDTPRHTSLAAYVRYTLALPGTKAMCREGGCGACIVSVRARRPSGRAETFSVNSLGCLTDTPCNTSLAAYLRYALALPGTKAMCREGGCGACIVSVRARRPSGRTETFSVNSVGCFSCLTDTPCNTSLAAYVRYELALPGTKAMCREGGCGACIVSVRARRPSGRTETFSVNSVGCLTDTPRHTSLAAYVRYTLALPGTKAMCREGGCGACIVSVRARRPSGRTETFSVNSLGCLTDTPCNTSLAAYLRYALALPGTKAMCREGGCGACIVSVHARRPSGRAETFSVNSLGCLTDTPCNTSLAAYLRYALALPGTKAMCREGGCGACIVSVHARRPSGRAETFSVNSCLVLVFSCHGWDITTVEGVGSRLHGYSEIQKRITGFNGSQCGYCTPGWVMHMHSLQDKNLTMAELERSFGSNTCRCTGFRPILDTMKSFAVDASPQLCQKVNDIEDVNICSKTKKICERKCSVFSEDSDWSVVNDVEKENDDTIAFSFGKQKFFKVYDVNKVFEILDKNGVDSYMLVDGNTGKGTVETFEYPRVLIDISGIKSLKTYKFDQNLILGANMALEDCRNLFKDTAKTKSEFAYLAEFAKHFELIAHIPVRKIGSLAGNLMLKHANPSYQSDVFLLFEAVGAAVTVRKSNGSENTITLLDFLKLDMRGILMTKIELPPLGSTYLFRSYKIMPRNQNALAIVNAAFLFKINAKTKIVEDAAIVYGNISPTLVHANATEKFLKGKMLFNNAILQSAIKILEKEIVPKYDPAQPSPDFRKKLAIGLFYKAILNICPTNALSPRFRSGSCLIQRPLSHGTQEFQQDSSLFPLNQPVPKLEAIIQSSGEAKYVNDIPPMPREVFGAFVQATINNGELEAVDGSDVLSIDGVLAIFTAKDIPGVNSFSVPGFQLQSEEEEIIVSNKILYYGQPVAIVVATSEELANRVAKKVKVTYKNVSSAAPVLTIDQAKKDSKRYVPSDVSIKPKGKGTDVKKIVKGVYEIEGQYLYYLEPVTCVVVPVDKGLDVYDSTQWMDLTQRAISRCLNMNESDVHLNVRRIGGGFGGKISRNTRAAAACALVARKLDVPCRFIVPIQTNMAVSGGRLPCQCDYEIGVDDNGKIQYLNATVVEDNGCSNNENILAYMISGFPNCYNADYFNVKTATVTTDTSSNSFARAPGTSEGMACIEHIMEHIAFAVQKDPTDVRIANMRTDDNDLPTLIDMWKKETDYDKRLQDIQAFNNANRWMKKAIKINVMSFPVEFYGNYSAMVSIYRGDGTVTVTTGGVEMGQGVNTKAAQVCAYELGIPLSQVTVLPNYSFVAANNVFSGSSIVSESVCYSIIRSCDILKKRLEPIRQQMSNPTWSELITKAGEEEIDLTASYMMTEKEDDLKNYSAFAVAILEVQLDVLTARYEILRADILEDGGLSTNPAIDVGQVEGAYVQGLGYFTTEKLVRDKKTGKLLSNRSLTYHVPLALDIPADFRVKLRFNSKNKMGVLGSKAVGEMGICTAHGITHALRQAILESRGDSGYDASQWINIDVPYDAESIMNALDVKLEEFLITEFPH